MLRAYKQIKIWIILSFLVEKSKQFILCWKFHFSLMEETLIAATLRRDKTLVLASKCSSENVTLSVASTLIQL